MLEIGKRVLTGLVGSIEVPAQSSVISDTENLVKQAKELENEEERLKSDFPAATKVMDPEDETSSTDNDGNSHESESSGIIVEKEEIPTAKTEMPADGPEKSKELSDDVPKDCCKETAAGDAGDTVVTETAEKST